MNLIFYIVNYSFFRWAFVPSTEITGAFYYPFYISLVMKSVFFIFILINYFENNRIILHNTFGLSYHRMIQGLMVPDHATFV